MIFLPISAGIACALSLGNKVLHKIIKNKYFENKRKFRKDEQTKKIFDKFYRKPIQDNSIDKSEYEPPCKIFTKTLDQTKNGCFL